MLKATLDNAPEQVDGRRRATVLPEDKVKVKDADQLELIVRYQKFFDEAEAEYSRLLEQTGEWRNLTRMGHSHEPPSHTRHGIRRFCWFSNDG